MAEAERVARSLKCGAMGLTVSPANDSAVRFYKRLGWVTVIERGEWSGRMEKRLSND
jgi:ribosomal protein S18 acetylase RimI-like enzyme